jgi:glycerol-3-phosphate acyltransferase PlsX
MTSQNQEKRKIKIALDAMGGDFAPLNEVQGVFDAFKNNMTGCDIEVVLVGDDTKIRAAVAKYIDKKYSNNVTVEHADQVITMDDEPTAGLKSKKNSSLTKGVELLKNGYVDAFVSAGNTGAVMSTSTILNGRIKGVSRPTIGTFIPTLKKSPTLLLDVGANAECKPKFLYEFAVMGSIYATHMFGLENPGVGLLNIGEEPGKGTETVQQAYKLLKASQLNFIGNIEGRDILPGTADVVVCDGFTGNVILKFAESVIGFLKNKMKDFASRNAFNMAAVAMIAPIFRRIFKGMDYQEHGGVPLLGVNGVVIIGHGKSTPKAIQNMIFKAVETVKKDVNGKIEKALNPPVISKI